MKVIITGIISAVISVFFYLKFRCTDKKRSDDRMKYAVFFIYLICDCRIISGMFGHGYMTGAVCSAVILTNSMFILAQTDIKKRIIPNRYLAALLVIRSVLLILPLNGKDMLLYTDADSFLGLLFGFLITLVLSFISREGLGSGDIKMFAVVGYFAGLSGILDILLYTCVFCFVFSAISLILKKCSLKSSIPMAPFAFAGTVLHFSMLL